MFDFDLVVVVMLRVCYYVILPFACARMALVLVVVCVQYCCVRCRLIASMFPSSLLLRLCSCLFALMFYMCLCMVVVLCVCLALFFVCSVWGGCAPCVRV